MRFKPPQYNGKDNAVLAAIVLPCTLLFNAIVFGGRYFREPRLFWLATLITALLVVVDFMLSGAVAVYLRQRMPREEQTNRRMVAMILCFVAISGLFLLTIFHGYEAVPAFRYAYNETGFIWAYACMAMINILLTMLMEGIARYKTWRQNLKEAEAIRNTFAKSQLLGLKSQVNPHFLFNSLNTLSSLIQEDEKEAETFLNEMSKVYRYLLRGNDEHLVPLHTELKFVQSYAHLLHRRFGQSLQVTVDVRDEDLHRRLPPLSLQVLIENAFSQNRMTRSEPLRIAIASDGKQNLLVRNNRQPKTISNDLDAESGLDNLVAKYRLLGRRCAVHDTAAQRKVELPLLAEEGGDA